MRAHVAVRALDRDHARDSRPATALGQATRRISVQLAIVRLNEAWRASVPVMGRAIYSTASRLLPLRATFALTTAASDHARALVPDTPFLTARAAERALDIRGHPVVLGFDFELGHVRGYCARRARLRRGPGWAQHRESTCAGLARTVECAYSFTVPCW